MLHTYFVVVIKTIMINVSINAVEKLMHDDFIFNSELEIIN